MVDPTELANVLKILKANGVASYKDSNIDISFRIDSGPDQLIADPAEKTLPPDLRTDAINSHDSLLNWSAPPSADEKPLPLTGDIPL